MVRLAASAHAEAAMIADALRRAHLVDKVPWSQMAVIVRSVPRAGARLPRALAAAGVPVAAPAVGGALAEEPAVRALLTVLAATAEGLDGDQALALLTGPIGRVDPVSLRQLRRTLLRGKPADVAGSFGDLVVAALPAGRRPAAVSPAAAGACGPGRGRALPSRRPRSALHAVGGVESVRPAAPLVDGQRARRHRRRPGQPGTWRR